MDLEQIGFRDSLSEVERSDYDRILAEEGRAAAFGFIIGRRLRATTHPTLKINYPGRRLQ